MAGGDCKLSPLVPSHLKAGVRFTLVYKDTVLCSYGFLHGEGDADANVIMLKMMLAKTTGKIEGKGSALALGNLPCV